MLDRGSLKKSGVGRNLMTGGGGDSHLPKVLAELALDKNSDSTSDWCCQRAIIGTFDYSSWSVLMTNSGSFSGNMINC